MSNDFRSAIASRWDSFWHVRQPPHLLSVFRIAFCIVFLYRITSYFQFHHPQLWDAWDKKYYLDQIFFMPYFSFLPPPEYATFKIFLLMRLIGVVAVLVGLFSQLAMFLVALLFAYLFFLNQLFYNNHLYLFLLSTFICSFMPWGKTLSVDASIGRLLNKKTPEEVSFTAARLLQVLVSVIYFYSAVAKMTPEWISGDIMRACFDKGLIHANGLPLLSLVPFSSQAIAAIATELFLCFALWSKKYKAWAFFVGITFHLMLDVTMSISSFSQQMIVLYILFMDPQLHQHQVILSQTQKNGFLKKVIHGVDWFRRFEVVLKEGPEAAGSQKSSITLINPHGNTLQGWQAGLKIALSTPICIGLLCAIFYGITLK